MACRGVATTTANTSSRGNRPAAAAAKGMRSGHRALPRRRCCVRGLHLLEVCGGPAGTAQTARATRRRPAEITLVRSSLGVRVPGNQLGLQKKTGNLNIIQSLPRRSVHHQSRLCIPRRARVFQVYELFLQANGSGQERNQWKDWPCARRLHVSKSRTVVQKGDIA